MSTVVEEARSQQSSANAVFDRLLRDIVSGVYPPGARLPAERELSRLLGASRPTLREALRRLGEWGLINVRRGSGVEIRPQRDWSLYVLPAYVEYGAFQRGPAEVAKLVRDLLAVRRILFVDVLRVVGGHIRPGSLDVARTHVEAAWNARTFVDQFVREDFNALRAIVEAAEFLPAVWLLGSISSVYTGIAAALSDAALPPPDYVTTYNAIFNALEGGLTDEACQILEAYFQRHDRRLLAAWGIG
jgi:GntR family transcriptional repressor for pyruvate dehydrogenase complex